MMQQYQNELLTAVQNELSTLTSTSSDVLTELSLHQNLLEFVDSFGFVNLLIGLEQRLGITLDLTTVDIVELTRLENLLLLLDSSAVEV